MCNLLTIFKAECHTAASCPSSIVNFVSSCDAFFRSYGYKFSGGRVHKQLFSNEASSGYPPLYARLLPSMNRGLSFYGSFLVTLYVVSIRLQMLRTYSYARSGASLLHSSCGPHQFSNALLLSLSVWCHQYFSTRSLTSLYTLLIYLSISAFLHIQ